MWRTRGKGEHGGRKERKRGECGKGEEKRGETSFVPQKLAQTGPGYPKPFKEGQGNPRTESGKAVKVLRQVWKDPRWDRWNGMAFLGKDP